MKKLPILIGVSSVKYSYARSSIEIDGWLIPEHYQNFMRISYNDCEIVVTQKFNQKDPIKEKFVEYEVERPGWKTKTKLINVDPKLSNTIRFEIFTPDGDHLVDRNYDISFIDQKTEFDDIRAILLKRTVCAIGSFEVRKNYFFLYYAWKSLEERYGIKDLNLIIIGGKGFQSHDVMEIIKTDPETNSRIHILTNLEDELKNEVIDKSMFTIFPSSYEGWGLPVAESLHRGKVPFIGSLSSMKEISPSHCVHFNPFNLDEFCEKIKYYLETPKMLTELEYKICHEYQSQAWKNSAVELLKIFEED